MSSLSSGNLYQEEQVEENIEWLASFLSRTFFGSCRVHKNLQKNDLNRYCIDCDVSACKYCIASDTHSEHKLLKIYRHVYKDVVPLGDMETQINCSKIQPYRCNKKMVISLKPLPHCGSGVADKEGACDVCFRKLNDPVQYRFCSIACKYPVAESSDDTNSSKRSISDVETLPEEDDDEPEKKMRHRRKGCPCRAPFF